MKEFISYGSRSGDADLGRGSAALTPAQARAIQDHMIRSLGSRKCEHIGADITMLDGGGYQMECEACNLRACADETTAVRLGWIEAA